MQADVLPIFVAVMEVGPRGASLPTTTVHAASIDVRPSLADTVFTLIRWMADKSRPKLFCFEYLSLGKFSVC